ncbi:MAG: sensor histidine kinase [Planctomycetota bacterium]|jgi:signal transduction histidine kinase
MINRSGYGQLRWVILLLAVAVILPTVCLLWFMTQAVENVQLAAQQKLIDLYKEKLDRALPQVQSNWHERLNLIQKRSEEEPKVNFEYFALNANGADRAGGILITYDEYKRLYPTIDSATDEPNFPEEFESAWKLEFVERNFKEAWRLYNRIADSAQEDYIWRKAILGQARCEVGRGRTSLAMTMYYRKAAYDRLSRDMSSASVSLAAYARVMMAALEQQLNEQNTAELSRLMRTATYYGQGRLSERSFLPIDCTTRIFILQKAIEMAEKSPKVQEIEKNNRLDKAKRLLAAEQIAVEVAERYPNTAVFKEWAVGSARRLDVFNDVYGLYYESAGRTFLLVRPGEEVRKDFIAFEQSFEGSDILYRVSDDKGMFVSGIEQSGEKPFLTLAVGRNMPDWRVEIRFKDSDIFTKAASKERAIYIWAGILVIVLILATGGFAGQAVGRQMKLNRLKNDFIATVSHELKTPLASMRVLADTLLEGNYKDQKQATEYLHLICKENKRLSSLIDNFLTFSRMERNKHAFEMVKTSPAVIANAAVEAVKTKFSKGQRKFEEKISDYLPDVSADHDAMVTVLVNLLDNAYKYSHDDKHIELKVFTEEGLVCFSVSDDGIGMSQWAIKKIFKRFYQVDRSLSRRSEGCGLGLSIAKFIVDAHKGSITVNSKPGTGSTFTVKLPAAS